MMDKNMIREDIKILLNVLDDKQDSLLDVIINHTANHLELLLGKKIPSHLEFIVTEVGIVRFNRRGSEGMSNESVEGHSTSYIDNDFRQYHSIIESERNKSKTGGGGVFFLP